MNGEKCPICGTVVARLLALSRIDNKTMICDSCGTRQALEDFAKHYQKKLSPFERTRAQVYATGNKYAIENFEATHS